ncbi:DNA recombination protein RmuC [Fimbriimonas ginsengisoli]|nr:DNA recombination protein RmuC [Fimbriimonas ginsengisoli]
MLKNRGTDDTDALENERRALEDRYAQQLRDKDEVIAHAKAEANQLANELVAVRQEADSRVSALNDDLLGAIEQRSRGPEENERLAELEAHLSQRDAEIDRLGQELVEAKAAAMSKGNPDEINRLALELAELKVDLASANRTHDAILAAKESEFERLLKEKEASLQRERDLLTNHVQNQLEDQKKAFAATERALLAKLETVSDQSLRTATEQLVQAANETFNRASEQGSEVALKQETIDDLMKPVREALDRLERQNQQMDRRRESAFEAIERGVQQLTSEASQLANALRKPAAQGAWGDMTIQTILENAGLIAGENFILKDSGEDTKKRTDVVIKLPQDRMLVIDSKAPLEAFWDGMNAPNEETRAIRMKAHARLVRDHVRELGQAHYWAGYDSLPDCVIMFLPTEGAFFAALEAEPTLMQEAKEAGVYLANPMTVLNMAHIAAYVLADERVRQNAQEIKDLGSELYERLRMFGEHFSNVGQNLRQSVDSYNKALSWIDRNVMPTARKMQLQGVQKGKALTPASHIDKSVKSFQNADLRELPVESTYEEPIEEEV